MSGSPPPGGDVARPPDWRIPAGLLAAATVAQVAAAVMLVAASPELARGWAYGPDQLALVHLYGIAMLTVAILGALAQLVPVITRTPLGSDAVTAAAGGAAALGGWALAGGLWEGADRLVAVGGAAVTIGCLAMIVQLAVALTRAARGRTLGDAGLGIALALVWLAAVVALGVILVIERRHPFLGVDRLAMLGVHGTVAIGGWVGGAVLAVALRLTPMFALAHGHARWPGRLTLGLWHPAVGVTAAGLLAGRGGLVVAGSVLGIGAMAAFGAFLLDVARRRHRAVEAPGRHMAIAAGSGLVAFAAVLGAATGAVEDMRAGILAALAGLIGIGAGATSGHLAKILPMIVWTGRHARLAGTPGAPRLADMQPPALVIAEQWLFGVGLAVLLTGVALGSAPLVRTGAALLVGAAAAVLVLAVLVLAGWHRHPARGRARRAGVPARQP